MNSQCARVTVHLLIKHRVSGFFMLSLHSHPTHTPRRASEAKGLKSALRVLGSALVYRSKSFDMIFQLTANPFIVSLIKASHGMTSSLHHPAGETRQSEEFLPLICFY
jgi:hypothetical protein